VRGRMLTTEAEKRVVADEFARVETEFVLTEFKRWYARVGRTLVMDGVKPEEVAQLAWLQGAVVATKVSTEALRGLGGGK
jgi:ribosome biogenesis SPOUT family RNA methylase Rps3